MKTELEQIIKLSQVKDKTTEQVILLNNLVLSAGQSILLEKGKTFNVVSAKRTMKVGCCFANAIKKMRDKGYIYVEGYITNKESGYKLAHAWNVDSNGVAVDYTLADASNYSYYGMEVEENTVREIGFNNGCIWYSTIPFIKIN